MANLTGADERLTVPTYPASIESRGSWVAAGITLAVLSISFGSPLLVVVGLQPMTQALGTDRSVIALAGSLVWIGNGVGGILMGWLADRIGIRTTIVLGAVMMALGLAVSTLGSIWALYVGHGLLVGLLGNGALYAPLVIHVSRWFDRRRGTAIALISSGQYVAGVVWPAIFERGIAAFGWQATMLAYAAVVLLIILPLVPFLQRAPDALAGAAVSAGNGAHRGQVLGLPAERNPGADLRGGFLLLHSDGDPEFSPCGILRRCGHPTHSWRRDAVRDAGIGVRRPPGLGRHGGPAWRAADHPGGVRFPGARDPGLYADPKRGRAVRGCRRLRVRLQRADPIFTR